MKGFGECGGDTQPDWAYRATWNRARGRGTDRLAAGSWQLAVCNTKPDWQTGGHGGAGEDRDGCENRDVNSWEGGRKGRVPAEDAGVRGLMETKSSLDLSTLAVLRLRLMRGIMRCM